MFDRRLRPWIDPPLASLAHIAVRAGLTADGLTLGGCALGLVGAALIGMNQPLVGLAFFLAGRVVDGLDGAVARLQGKTDRGGYLDIVCDFWVYAAVPLGFAVASPSVNALAASVLLASFLANGAAFLAFAVMAERRGLATSAQGEKSLYYLAGLAEGAETIAIFTACALWPTWFPVLAVAFAVVCLVSALARMMVAWRLLG